MRSPSLERLWAEGGTEEVVPDDLYLDGFLSVRPKAEHLNKLQKDEEAFYLANRESGLPVVIGGEPISYVEGALASVGGKVSVRVGNAFVESSFGGSLKESSDRLTNFYNTAMLPHFVDKNNPHNTTASQAGAYTKTEADAKVRATADDVSDHEDDFSNPHNLTYTQLNTLGTSTGGVFTGQVTFQKKITVNGEDVSSSSDGFILGSPSGIGLDDKEPFVKVGGKKCTILHGGNYTDQRNNFSPKFHLPSPILEVPLTGGLDMILGGSYLTSSWDDLTFTSEGLKLEGTLSVAGPTLFICPEQTVSCKLVGDCTVSLGSVTISSLEGGSTSVLDGGVGVWSGTVDGNITYSRNTTGGLVSINGSVVAEVSHEDLPSTLVADIQGVGSIRGLRVWSSFLSKEQLSKIT